MDRKSVAIVGAVVVAVLVAIGVGIALNSGGGSQSVRTTPGSVTTAPPTLPATTTTRPAITAPLNTVPPPPKPTVVIRRPATTVAPTTAAAPTTAPATTTTQPSGATDVGITATEIRLTAIADSGPVLRGVEAWAAGVNKTGGLAHRAVRVDARLVTSAADYAAAVGNACTNSFAIVGSSSIFDSQSAGLGCGIPEVATRIADDAHRALPNTYAAIPARTGLERVGAFKRLLASVSGCCRQYVLVPSAGLARAATQRSLQAAAAAGFTTAATPDVDPNATPADYSNLVRDLVARQATFARSGLGAASTVLLRKAAAADPGGAAVKAWYCDASCGDPSFIATGGTAVDGQYIDLGVNPLSDQHAIPAIGTYVREVKHLGATPTNAGVESYSAGLLFERAARQVVTASGTNGVTRVRLLGALGEVHDFNAGGIVGTTDIAARQPTGCYVLVQIKGGHFVRSFPAAPAQLDCGPQNLQMEG